MKNLPTDVFIQPMFLIAIASVLELSCSQYNMVENTDYRRREGMITAANSSEGRTKPWWDSNWKPLSTAAAKSWKHGGGALYLDLLERELWMWQCERTDLRSALVFCFGTKLIFIDVMMMWCGRWNFEIVMPSCLPHSSQGCTDWPHSGSKLH